MYFTTSSTITTAAAAAVAAVCMYGTGNSLGLPGGGTWKRKKSEKIQVLDVPLSTLYTQTSITIFIYIG